MSALALKTVPGARTQEPQTIRRVLLLNPFTFSGTNPNIGMDPVVSRHAGQEIKTGVTLPIGLCYMAAVLLREGFEVELLDPLAEEIPVPRIMEAARRADAVVMAFSAQHTDDIRRFMGGALRQVPRTGRVLRQAHPREAPRSGLL